MRKNGSMKTQLDVHTHTVASGHAYSTIQEMATAAAHMGLKILGITEHGPSIPGTCQPIYFRNMHCVPREMYGVKLMMGAELNILNTQGEIDLDESDLRTLDLRIAGIHSLCWQGGTKEENTAGVIQAMRNPYVQSSAIRATARRCSTSSNWCWRRRRPTRCSRSTTTRWRPPATRPWRAPTTSNCSNWPRSIRCP